MGLMRECCEIAVLLLWGCCGGIAVMGLLWWGCCESDLGLLWNCCGIAVTLLWYSVELLWDCCVIAVVGLVWDCTSRIIFLFCGHVLSLLHQCLKYVLF